MGLIEICLHQLVHYNPTCMVDFYGINVGKYVSAMDSIWDVKPYA